jgi:RND family efflux transporter MFP subunit
MLALAMLWLLAGPAFAAQPLGCLIEALRSTDVGSPVIGVVQNVAVERGDVVRKGQVLAVLRASVERATLNVAASRAESSAEVLAAQAGAKFSRERLTRAEDLLRQQFISQQALDQARAESVQADQKLALVREQRVLSKQEREVAAAQLSQRVIRSPFDGVIAERFVSAGERVDDKPIVRVAKVDPLRVQLVVPVAMYAEVLLGGLATVLPELPGAAPVQARVSMVDKVVDPASNTFRVHLELPNPNGALPAGLRCRAQLGAPGVAATPVAPLTSAGVAAAKAP